MLLHSLHLDLILLSFLSLIACHEGFDADGNQANTCRLKQQEPKQHSDMSPNSYPHIKLFPRVLKATHLFCYISAIVSHTVQ